MSDIFDFFVAPRRDLIATRNISEIEPRYKAAFAFIHHPNMSCYMVRNRAFVRKVDGALMNGITEQIKRIIHPYDLNIATGGAKTGGSARGRLVDKQLADLINHGIYPEKNKFHKYTLKVMEYLLDNDLIPVASQVLVACDTLMLGTPLDLICVDGRMEDFDNNLVNIQLKTGFDKNYEKANGKMMSPFFSSPILMELDDSYFNRHMIQNMIEHWIVNMNYDKALGRSQVLVVSENSIRCDVLVSAEKNEKAAELYAAILNELVNRNNKSDYAIAKVNMRKHYARNAAVEYKKTNKKSNK